MNGSLVRYLRRKTEEHVTSPQTGQRPPRLANKYVDLLNGGDLVLRVHRAEPLMDLLQDPEETTMTSHRRANNRRGGGHVSQTWFT